MIRWAQSKCNRNQVVLFAPTLDDSIAQDHPVRLFDEVLAGLDFGSWEAEYERVDGQPPIHPRVVAGTILYGLSLGIRSSRKLEDATANRLDFIWLCHGRVIDHATLAKFRVKFAEPIKDLFRQVGKLAIRMGMANLNQIALDGTAKRSNNSRYKTARRTSLEQKLAALDEQVEQMMGQWHAQDQKEQELFGSGDEASPTKLPRELKDLSRRQQSLREAMKKLEQLEQKRTGRKDVSAKGPAVPTTDPDSSVMKNKAGGFAPNYTTVLATESQNGFIVDAQVLGDNDEPGSVLPAVKQIQDNFGHKPEELLADSNFNTGPNLQELSDEGIQPWMPPKQQPLAETNPALRQDPTQPVAAEQHEKLPLSPQLKVLDKSAFVYDSRQDCYYCPMGQPLPFAQTTSYVRDRVKGTYRVYECSGGCGQCVLRGKCLAGKSAVRRIVRDEYETLREEMGLRMSSEAGQDKYKRRSFLCETPFAVMNTTMNFRQFLLRGIAKAGTELMWTCGAMNLAKLMRLLLARQQLALEA